MDLSRIWSYIILISILVAGFHYIQGDKNIFNDLVTARSAAPDGIMTRRSAASALTHWAHDEQCAENTKHWTSYFHYF